MGLGSWVSARAGTSLEPKPSLAFELEPRLVPPLVLARLKIGLGETETRLKIGLGLAIVSLSLAKSR